MAGTENTSDTSVDSEVGPCVVKEVRVTSILGWRCDGDLAVRWWPVDSGVTDSESGGYSLEACAVHEIRGAHNGNNVASA